MLCGERRVTLQITVLKVLAGHPDGRASVADLTRYVAVLMSSGADWSLRAKKLAARTPELDIFTSGYVLRDSSGWSITDLGRTFLTSIETPISDAAMEIAHEVLQPSAAAERPGNVIQIAEHREKRRRAAA